MRQSELAGRVGPTVAAVQPWLGISDIRRSTPTVGSSFLARRHAVSVELCASPRKRRRPPKTATVWRLDSKRADGRKLVPSRVRNCARLLLASVDGEKT